ncbi:MAG: hypothetical protein ACMUIU_01850 [bacterium]
MVKNEGADKTISVLIKKLGEELDQDFPVSSDFPEGSELRKIWDLKIEGNGSNKWITEEYTLFKVLTVRFLIQIQDKLTN